MLLLNLTGHVCQTRWKFARKNPSLPLPCLTSWPRMSSMELACDLYAWVFHTLSVYNLIFNSDTFRCRLDRIEQFCHLLYLIGPLYLKWESKPGPFKGISDTGDCMMHAGTSVQIAPRLTISNTCKIRICTQTLTLCEDKMGSHPLNRTTWSRMHSFIGRSPGCNDKHLEAPDYF
jgi:hypothetical protein